MDWAKICMDLCVFEFENSDHMIRGSGFIFEIKEMLVVKQQNEQRKILRASCVLAASNDKQMEFSNFLLEW
jgi:hypothetical protein